MKQVMNQKEEPRLVPRLRSTAKPYLPRLRHRAWGMRDLHLTLAALATYDDTWTSISVVTEGRVFTVTSAGHGAPLRFYLT